MRALGSVPIDIAAMQDCTKAAAIGEVIVAQCTRLKLPLHWCTSALAVSAVRLIVAHGGDGVQLLNFLRTVLTIAAAKGIAPPADDATPRSAVVH